MVSGILLILKCETRPALSGDNQQKRKSWHNCSYSFLICSCKCLKIVVNLLLVK